MLFNMIHWLYDTDFQLLMGSFRNKKKYFNIVQLVYILCNKQIMIGIFHEYKRLQKKSYTWKMRVAHYSIPVTTIYIYIIRFC